jgi:hypothetical protein
MKIFDSLRQLLLGKILGDSVVILVNVNIPVVLAVVLLCRFSLPGLSHQAFYLALQLHYHPLLCNYLLCLFLHDCVSGS